MTSSLKPILMGDLLEIFNTQHSLIMNKKSWDPNLRAIFIYSGLSTYIQQSRRTSHKFVQKDAVSTSNNCWPMMHRKVGFRNLPRQKNQQPFGTWVRIQYIQVDKSRHRGAYSSYKRIKDAGGSHIESSAIFSIEMHAIANLLSSKICLLQSFSIHCASSTGEISYIQKNQQFRFWDYLFWKLFLGCYLFI